MTGWSWFLLVLVFVPIVAAWIVDLRRNPPDLGPVQRKPKPYDFEEAEK